MSFKITRQPHQVIAGERLFLDRTQKKVVPEGSKESAYLLAGIGQGIPIQRAIALGLVEGDASIKVRDPGPEKKIVKGVEPETRSTRPAEIEAKR